MNLCIIPARGGSKRIPRKNIRKFYGKPMIAWSIETAKAAGCFDRVVVSTDDEEIASIGKSWGAEIPFIRPAHLADDHTETGAVMAHAVNQLLGEEHDPISICCLYASAPFLEPEDLIQGLSIFENTGSRSFVLTATTFPYPIQRALRLDSKTNLTSMWFPEQYLARSQDLEGAYHDAG